ncbi:MAG: YkgJ family cysteine cluster protein [Bacteroidia bacterium]|nr:YkgJ family cysteine cluster protein [Bacteroidia bacterium]
MNPEQILVFIKQEARQKESENYTFRTFLKRFSAKEIDEKLHRIAKEETEATDCTQCGNCCKKLMASPEPKAIKALSVATGCDSPEAFKEKYLQLSVEDQVYFFRDSPCPLLKGNCCTQYEIRPQSCRDYPNLHKRDFIFRVLSVIGNYGICPIVYHSVERLKKETGFKSSKI